MEMVGVGWMCVCMCAVEVWNGKCNENETKWRHRANITRSTKIGTHIRLYTVIIYYWRSHKFCIAFNDTNLLENCEMSDGCMHDVRFHRQSSQFMWRKKNVRIDGVALPCGISSEHTFDARTEQSMV